MPHRFRHGFGMGIVDIAHRWVAAGLAGIVLGGSVPAAWAATGAQAADSRAILGAVTYRERVKLPPQARMRLVLEEAGRADAPSTVVAEQDIPITGAPPFAFRLDYDAARIDAHARHVLRAEIRVDGWVWFTSGIHADPFRQPSGRPLNLWLRRVGHSSPHGGIDVASLPASFVGTLPCADCPGVRHTLNLRPDDTFALRLEYIGKAGAFDDIGRWELDPETRRITLWGARERLWRVTVINRDTLRVLDGESREIVTDPPSELRRAASLQVFEPRLALRGMYRDAGDAGEFEECLSERFMPVSTEADFPALARAVEDKQARPGAWLLVTLQGRIVPRARASGAGLLDTLVVERFSGVWPGHNCEGPRADAPPVTAPALRPVMPTSAAPQASAAGAKGAAPAAQALPETSGDMPAAQALSAAREDAGLENTYWKMLRACERDLNSPEGNREPHLVLDAENRELQAFDGCNPLIGGYVVDRERLLFGPATSAGAVCEGEARTYESLFGRMLRAARFWHIEGDTLELLDASGMLVARFAAGSRPAQ